ncbi:hypothetical protein [Thermoactinomyces sp. DSM 45892]|uniref:hypothetical protein n=1 Tax=Thermoactinomyces sp. DSM 45892 TaxID=1882753 RepID=UPI00089CC3D9|nr:hypothetical protein [Thermoactinomyces sp. DSM 45892]SDX95693.1 hypothetical protein SAMN05444416_10199 [Thermoactinomyces sp. DSM 45892]
MPNIQYGLKEVANVIFFDASTNKPIIFFDTLKVSSIENESESTEARGGQGNGKLMSWDFGRTATLTMQDALLSDASLAMLSGNALQQSNIKVVGREVLSATGATATKVTLKETPLTNSVTVYKMAGGMMTTEVTTFTTSAKDVSFSAGVKDGDQLMVFYEYTIADNTATLVTFSAEKFPATYRVVGDTVVRGRDGVDRKMQFLIPRAKLQSSFTFTMDAENVSTFDFNLDIIVEAGTNKLYDIVRFA